MARRSTPEHPAIYATYAIYGPPMLSADARYEHRLQLAVMARSRSEVL